MDMIRKPLFESPMKFCFFFPPLNWIDVVNGGAYHRALGQLLVQIAAPQCYYLIRLIMRKSDMQSPPSFGMSTILAVLRLS
jgi:hypothetical protein